MLFHRMFAVGLMVLMLVGSTYAATIKTVDKGISIAAGTLGRFTMKYPELLGSGNKIVHAIIEKQADGKTATVKYEGGAVLNVRVDDDTVIFRFTNMPDDVKNIKTMAILPFNGLQGGSYHIDDGKPVNFPVEKPSKPHLFQGNAHTLTLKQADGTELQLDAPRNYTYQQLTDNREWGWKAYGWMTLSPFDPANSVYKFRAFTPKVAEGQSAQRVILVDPFGQSMKVDFPDKVHSLTELKADVDAEKSYYDSLTPPQFDEYGGLPGSGEKLGLSKTGFFHVEKKGKKWYMVDPVGNLFYPLGVCVYGPVDDYTYIRGRESIYEWLPSPNGEFATAFRKNEPFAFSFHLANQIRKYGEPFNLVDYQRRMLERLRKWGFNTVGPFTSPTSAVQEMNFPYVVTVPYGPWPGMPNLPGSIRIWDPFDQVNRDRVEKYFAKSLPTRADDPLLIGYYLSNEPIYEDLPRVVARLDGTKHACKRRLVQMLEEKYGAIGAFNKAWGMQAGNFDDLVQPGLPLTTKTAAEDMQTFADIFFTEYYKLNVETFRKYDSHHMVIGNRFQSGTINNEHLLRIAGQYLDVISFNYYTYGVDADFLNRIYKWSGKPMMLTEWYYDSPKESGLPGGGKDVGSQAERGLAYRNYVEQTAAMDFIVGQTWFTLVDQSLTGRWFGKYNGENGNTGFIAVTDRPWKALLEQAIKTNYTIYDVVKGNRPPYAFDDPRFQMQASASKRLSIPRAAGEVAMDGTVAGFPGTPAEQISGKRLVLGTDAGQLEASFKVCYDDTNLYVLVNVTDPSPMQNDRDPKYLWSGDAVELFIGFDKPDEPGQLQFTDRQILLGAGPRGRSYVSNVENQPVIRTVVVPGVDGKSYVLQAAIPVDVLGFRPKLEQAIRFDIGIDDSANGRRRDRQLMWNGNARNAKDRTGWGMAVFTR